MKKYIIDVSWVVTSSVEIEANSYAEAVDAAFQIPLADFEPLYLGDSFEVYDVTESP